jgi:hypothetical protein
LEEESSQQKKAQVDQQNQSADSKEAPDERSINSAPKIEGPVLLFGAEQKRAQA